MPKHRYLLLRNQAAQRDWAISVISDVVMVRFGPTGGALRQQEVRRSSWRGNSAEEAATNRANEELAQGFVVIGTCAFDQDDLVVGLETCEAPAVPVHTVQRRDETARKRPIITWQISAPVWDHLAAVMHSAAEALRPRAAVDWASHNGLPSGAPVIDGWPLVLSGHTGSGPVNCVGSVDQGDPPHALTYLLLMQMFAQGTQVSVVLVDPSAVTIDLRLNSVQSAYAACEIDFAPLKVQLEDLGVIPRVVTLGDSVKRRFRF